VNHSRPNITKTIAGAGLLVGILDISDALIFYGLRGASPVRIFQSIAYALLGKNAFKMGIASAVVGLLMHFFIAYTVSTIFLLAAVKLPLSRYPLLYGTLYGLAVYGVMNYIVLPATHIGLRPTPPLIPLINGVAALIFCVGIPLAFIARRYALQPRL
jgi:hypothetical protein